MSNVCIITGKRTQTGNNVSHSQRKTKRTFMPNMQSTSFYSNILKRKIKIRKITTNGINTIMKYVGGIDEYLARFTNYRNLHKTLQPIWKQVIAMTKKTSQ